MFSGKKYIDLNTKIKINYLNNYLKKKHIIVKYIWSGRSG